MAMSVEIGIDSKLFSIDFVKLSNENKSFTSMVGVAITTDDSKKLRANFEKISKSVFSELGIETDRKILSSYEILEKTGGDMEAHRRIFNALRNESIKINVFYTTFNQKRIPKIKVFGRIGTRELTVDEFYDSHLTNAFNHVCAWRLLDYWSKNKATFYIDKFFTYTTGAWEQIKNENIFILQNGDKCNPLICAADITLVYLESELKSRRRSLYPNCIKDALGYHDNTNNSRIYIDIICNKHLPQITPLEKKNMNLDAFMKHPCFFLIKAVKTDIHLDVILSNSDNLLNKVYEVHGSICFFHERSHKNAMHDGDFLIYFDEEGKRNAELLRKISRKKINIHGYEEFNI